MDDRLLVRDLWLALDAVSGQGADAQAKAIREVLDKHGATMNDVARIVGRIRQRRRSELGGLASRLDALAERRADAEETAAAVDAFLRTHGSGER